MAKDTDKISDDLDQKLAGLGSGEPEDAIEADSDLELTPAEKRKLDKEAKAEIAKELKADKMRDYKDAAKIAAKRQALFRHGKDEKGDDLETVFVSLAQHTPFIALDGKRYYNGQAYRLSRNTAAVMKDQMHRGEMHENEIQGKNMKDFYMHRPQNRVINPNSAVNLPSGY